MFPRASVGAGATTLAVRIWQDRLSHFCVASAMQYAFPRWRVGTSLEEGHYLIHIPAQTAVKVLLTQALAEAAISKVELAKRIQCDEKEVRRLLDPKHASKLPKLEVALKVLGCKLIVERTKIQHLLPYDGIK